MSTGALPLPCLSLARPTRPSGETKPSLLSKQDQPTLLDHHSAASLFSPIQHATMGMSYLSSCLFPAHLPPPHLVGHRYPRSRVIGSLLLYQLRHRPSSTRLSLLILLTSLLTSFAADTADNYRPVSQIRLRVSPLLPTSSLHIVASLSRRTPSHYFTQIAPHCCRLAARMRLDD